MNRLLLSFMFAAMVLGSPLGEGQAQENIQQDDQELQVSIEARDTIQTGKNIIFRAGSQRIPENQQLQNFRWDFGDGETSTEEEIPHIFQESGSYVVKLEVDLANVEGTVLDTLLVEKEIFVYRRALFLLTDFAQDEERIASISTRAQEQGVYIESIQSLVNLRLKDRLLKRIERELEQINDSDTVMVWSDRVELVTLLNSFAEQVNWGEKDFVVITEGNIGLLENILLGVEANLKPKRIIITRREAIDEFFTTQDGQDVLEVINMRGYDNAVLDPLNPKAFSIFELPSYGLSYLQEKGVEDSVLLIVLFLPLIVTLVTFFRLVVGFSSAGARVPVLLTFAFFVLGWKLGLAAILVLGIISYGFRVFFFKSHLLYIAKVGILTSFLGVVLLFVIGVSLWLGGEFSLASALMLVILATSIDRVVGVEGERGLWSVARVFVETLMIALLSFFVVSWSWLQILIVAHPEILVLFILANVFMGRFTGLRLLEYFRFREVLRYTEE